MSDLLYPDESYKIVGACFEVYNGMGCGFLESVYQECLAIEFECQNVSFTAQPLQHLHYRDRSLQQTYKPDFICYKNIIVEIKAVSRLVDEHRAQLLNYLHATRLQLGILIDFGHYPKLEYERIALSNRRHDH